ncbi:hypothetical protein A3715_10355 [Oleiphilus sp. HI0009]|nr:hypothetical protein A3715_10355 [Oleiphilus sp. HI0009]
MDELTRLTNQWNSRALKLEDAALFIRLLKDENHSLKIENTLLRQAHFNARELMRNNGVDQERADKAYESLKSVVYAINKFDSQ